MLSLLFSQKHVELEKSNFYLNTSRSGGVVPREAHNLQAPVQFRPPQHVMKKTPSLGFFSLRSLGEEKANCFAFVRNCKTESCRPATDEFGQEVLSKARGIEVFCLAT